jgi:hypothetical protein
MNLLESGGLQVDTRPTYITRETKDICMYGESTYTGIDIDTSVEVHWIFVSIKEHEQAKQ